MLSTQPYKGTRDFFPADQAIQAWMFDCMRTVTEGFGYQEYNGPMLEPFELYAAKTGEEIVNQQLYWMIDRGERKLAVRPEMTPTMARMVASKQMELPKPIRWFSIPNVWRYERPQRGRLREHWQVNVDVLGGDRVLADAEVLTLALDLMEYFGGRQFISAKINNRRLVDEVFKKRLGLTPEQALGASKAIDARPKIGEAKYETWLSELGLNDAHRKGLEQFFASSLEQIASLYPCEGTTELVALFERLKESGVDEQAVFDPTIMRGLDYYTGTVFEIFDTSPENNRAMFGGGRYDNLVGMFGGQELSGVGFGMGDVTLRQFLEVHELLPKLTTGAQVYVTLPGLEYRVEAEKAARLLRKQGYRVMTPLSVDGLGAQLKQATKHGASIAIVFAPEEFARGAVLIKDLTKGEQLEVKLKDLAQAVWGVKPL